LNLCTDRKIEMEKASKNDEMLQSLIPLVVETDDRRFARKCPRRLFHAHHVKDVEFFTNLVVYGSV